MKADLLALFIRVNQRLSAARTGDDIQPRRQDLPRAAQRWARRRRTTETRFHFHQQGNIVHADYFGGRVKLGKLLGLLDGNAMRHHYLQINNRDEFHTGHSIDEIRLTPEGKIQLIDTWKWEAKQGSGVCILEEL